MNNKGQPRNLVQEIQFLYIAISTVIVVSVQILSMVLVATFMVQDIKEQALVSSNEVITFLGEPLYNMDEEQAVRIAEALISSGRIEGIKLTSTATGLLFDRQTERKARTISPIVKDIKWKEVLVGKVELFYSEDEIANTLERIAIIALFVVLSITITFFLANRLVIDKRISKPLASIIDGIQTISSGRYDRVFDQTRYSDVNMLINLMNEMTSKIRAKNQELVEANIGLEERVAQRTEALELSLKDLRIAQDRLVQSEKLSLLGQLSAGMAHELNTPLGAILSSNRIIIEFLESHLGEVLENIQKAPSEGLLLFRNTLDRGLKKAATVETGDSNRKVQKSLAQKLEGLAVPNHREVAEILVNMDMGDAADHLMPELAIPENVAVLSTASRIIAARKMAEIIQIGGQKAASVIGALRSYLMDTAKDRKTVVDVNSDIDLALTMMHNMLKQGVSVSRDYSQVRVLGASEKLSQVWINLIRNAAQAMDFKGSLQIRTRQSGDKVTVEIQDSGSGIAPEIEDKIFSPFFSTKKAGENMGLGLDICRDIVTSHGGDITFRSRPGETVFTVTLPACEGDGEGQIANADNQA